jgi:hypothetical protein
LPAVRPRLISLFVLEVRSEALVSEYAAAEAPCGRRECRLCCAKPSEVSVGLAGEMQGRRRERTLRSGQGRHLDPTDAAPRRIVPCLAPRKAGVLGMQRPKALALACESAATAVSRVGRRRRPAKLDRRRLQWVDASGICRGASRGRRGREAEGGGLLNRYRVVKLYRGFESLRLRHRLRY